MTPLLPTWLFGCVVAVLIFLSPVAGQDSVNDEDGKAPTVLYS
jgi:hypothetical protein